MTGAVDQSNHTMLLNFSKNCVVKFLSCLKGRQENLTCSELLYIKLLNHLKNSSKAVSSGRCTLILELENNPYILQQNKGQWNPETVNTSLDLLSFTDILLSRASRFTMCICHTSAEMTAVRTAAALLAKLWLPHSGHDADGNILLSRQHNKYSFYCKLDLFFVPGFS